MTNLKVTVSGSFHRHMLAIYEAVGELRSFGVDVLSPADPRVVDSLGEFLFVASDKLRSIKLVQDRHFEAIGASDFLWVVCPDGYTGPSTCMEIGDARRAGVPVFSDRCPLDITVQRYVKTVPSLRIAVETSLMLRRMPRTSPHVLLDPPTYLEHNIRSLESLKPILTNSNRGGLDPELAFNNARKALADSFGLKK